MSQSTIKDVLVESIGAPPVTTIDVDARIARMRRRHLLRTGTTASMVVIAVAAATVGISIALRPQRGPAFPIAVQPTVTVTPSPSATIPEIVPTTEPRDERDRRLKTLVTQLMRSAMPKATFIANRIDHPDTTAFQVISSSPLGIQVELGADIRDSLGTGNVLMVIGQSIGGAFETCPNPEDKANGSCKESTGPHGESIVAIADFLGDGSMARVDITRTDGTWVVIHSQAWGMRGATQKVSKATRPRPNLTVAQMIQIGTNSGLTL